MVATGWALRQELKDEKLKEARLARIEELEQNLLETAAGIIEAGLAFHEVTPTQQDPPPDWVERYGETAARQRLAVAKAAWMPQSLAPAALPLSVRMYVGITRGRGRQQQLVQNQLNVNLTLPAPTSKEHPSTAETYATKEIE